MVVYEVNLEIQQSIFNEYYQWLLEHVKEILKFDGFLQAEVGIIEKDSDDAIKKIRVNYSVDTYANLDKYLKNNAAAMRADAIKKFGIQFSASRRIIINQVVIN